MAVSAVVLLGKRVSGQCHSLCRARDWEPRKGQPDIGFPMAQLFRTVGDSNELTNYCPGNTILKQIHAFH
jgi:hypothetical protein